MKIKIIKEAVRRNEIRIGKEIGIRTGIWNGKATAVINAISNDIAIAI